MLLTLVFPVACCRYHPREKRGRLSPYGRSQRKRDEYSLNPIDDFPRTRRSPRELWDPPASDVPLPKTPSASPSAEEPTDLYPPAPAPAEAMYDVPPPCEAVKSERQTVMEDVSGVANFPSMSSSGGDTRIKAEMFDVMAPAFTPIERAVSGAPSQDDVQAILSQAHSSSSATVSVQKAADLRKKKWKEEKTRVKREVKEQRLAGAKDHVSSRPSTTSRLKNIPTSSILNESLESAMKSASAGLIVASGRYERSRPVSSGDDSEEVDVDTLTDDTSSILPVSISVSNLPASQSELTSKSSLDSGFHTGSSGPSSLTSSMTSKRAFHPSAKKRKKKKKDKKKDQEEPVNEASHMQAWNQIRECYSGFMQSCKQYLNHW